MIILFILGLLLGAVAVIFALQNVAIVTVTFFSWSITSSLSVIVSLAILSGILIALLLFLPESISNYFGYRKLKKENAKLIEELRKQKELTTFAKSTPPTKEDIYKIEDGVIDNRAL
jgi:lipopolysaccharide assembly protein A